LKKSEKSNIVFSSPISRTLKKMRHKIRCLLYPSESIFTEVYKQHVWGNGPSLSGEGSDLEHTKTLRNELPNLLQEFKVESMLDIPCGDFYWLKEVNLDFLTYIGADIVEHIIQENNNKYAKKNRTFMKLDISNYNLPKVDLIFCRDLFQHLSFKDIFKSLDNIKKSGSQYFLTSSHLSIKSNKDSVTGGARSLNLLHPPFSFPEPIKILSENFTEKESEDKSLLLWKINDL